MSSELDDLYQEVILDHGRRPRNFHRIEGARSAEGLNPLCGDHFTLYVKLDGELISDLAFEGSGCAISKASASLMTQSLKGKTRAEAEDLFRRFHTLVTEGPERARASELGKLAALSGVCEFPTRVKCASLVWHTLHSVIEGSGETVVTTE
ncbi:MAG TPA: SUF system NifU family Fe-S cluster assembly protein [Anaeromyxobacteraceae bacterium]|jgi:nitrogen fixation NifU-like protein|nr:SUF system NifU family Fe-S cluster assembly protein [Anaeromyxobacteraceae bacterium]